MTQRLLQTEADTVLLGERLMRAVEAPACIALYGDLGAGKTALVRGMGAALGERNVSSPTFNIVHEYDTVPRLLHFDAYRLADADALFDIGFADYLGLPNAVIVIEWAELVEEALPKEHLNIRIVGSGEEARVAEFTPCGARYERLVEKL